LKFAYYRLFNHISSLSVIRRKRSHRWIAPDSSQSRCIGRDVSAKTRVEVVDEHGLASLRKQLWQAVRGMTGSDKISTKLAASRLGVSWTTFC